MEERGKGVLVDENLERKKKRRLASESLPRKPKILLSVSRSSPILSQELHASLNL